MDSVQLADLVDECLCLQRHPASERTPCRLSALASTRIELAQWPNFRVLHDGQLLGRCAPAAKHRKKKQKKKEKKAKEKMKNEQ